MEQCPPTEPVTPAIKPCRTILGATFAISPLPSPLPIIAPPAYILIPRAPSGTEAIAEERLATMLVKEQKERLGDSLPVLHDMQRLQECDDPGAKSCKSAATSEYFDQLDSDGSTDRDTPTENRLMDCTEDRTASIDGDSVDGESLLETPLGVNMAIQEDFRREVIEWILGVSLDPSVSVFHRLRFVASSSSPENEVLPETVRTTVFPPRYSLACRTVVDKIFRSPWHFPR